VRKWIWIERSVILAAHDEQLADHGGSPGIRDAGLLDSALARPLNRAAYGKPDIAELAQLEQNPWSGDAKSTT
jgi:death on curing protein